MAYERIGGLLREVLRIPTSGQFPSGERPLGPETPVLAPAVSRRLTRPYWSRLPHRLSLFALRRVLPYPGDPSTAHEAFVQEGHLVRLVFHPPHVEEASDNEDAVA